MFTSGIWRLKVIYCCVTGIQKKAEINIIRENSDDIIDMVKERILRAVVDSHESMYREDMVQGIACFTCFCFMECKILEKPS